MKLMLRMAAFISFGLLLTSFIKSTDAFAAAEEQQGAVKLNAEINEASYSNCLGVWFDKATVDSGQLDNPTVKLVITGISKDKLLFSISKQSCRLESAIATKQADGSYQFSFREIKGKFDTICSYGTEYTGKILLKNGKLTAEIGGSTTEGIGYKGELMYASSLDEGLVCNLVDLMVDYDTVKSKEQSISLVEDTVTGLVSEASVIASGFDTKVNCYHVEGITVGSFQEDCITKFGQPVSTRVKGNYTEVVYLVDGKYYCTTLLNQYGAIESMKLNYSNEEEVLGLKTVGDYKIRGTKIIKYIGGYDTEKTIAIPKNITEIGEMAFSVDYDLLFIDQGSNMKKVSLCIPRNVKLDEDAFNMSGPMNITFEEGRRIIEKRAFRGCSDRLDGYKKGFEITLPSSIKSIEMGAFETDFCNDIILHLNEGLVEIGDYALRGTKCKLPSTVKKLGDYALDNRWYDPKAEGELSGGYVVLPDGLEEIGYRCISIENATKKITIPASVKKIGECPISYINEEAEGGVIVEKGNRYYKSDKNGWLYTKDGKTLLYAESFRGNLVIPEGVEYVAERSLNLWFNGVSESQKIILPKSLKKYNRSAAVNTKVVFQGNPPELVLIDAAEYFEMVRITFYVPQKKLKAYKAAFKVLKCKYKIIGQ